MRSFWAVLVLVGRRPRAAGELDFLLPHFGFAEIARQFAARAPEIDLERQRVQPRPAVEHPLQRRVGNEAAVPIIFAVDLGRRKSGRQRAAGDDMRRADAMGRGIEIDEVAGSDIHRADAEAHGAGIEPVEVHQALERRLQRSDVIEAELVGASGDGQNNGREQTRREEMRRAEQHDAQRAGLIDEAVNGIVPDRRSMRDMARREAAC